MQFRFTISRKLLALTSCALAFVAAVGSTGYLAAVSLESASARILADGKALKLQMQADMAHDALRSDLLAALQFGMRDSADGAKALQADLAAHSKQLVESVQELDAMGLDTHTREAVRQVRPLLDEYLSITKAVIALAYEDKPAALARMDAFMASFTKVEKEMAELREQIARRSAETQADAAQTAKVAQAAIVGVVLLALAVLLAVSVLIGRNIVSRVQRAAAIAETVATGDLTSTIRVEGRDEAAQLLAALAQMNSNLRGLVSTVRQGSGTSRPARCRSPAATRT